VLVNLIQQEQHGLLHPLGASAWSAINNVVINSNDIGAAFARGTLPGLVKTAPRLVEGIAVPIVAYYLLTDYRRFLGFFRHAGVPWHVWDVAVLAGPLDPRRDLASPLTGAVVELFFQAGVGAGSEVGSRHRARLAGPRVRLFRAIGHRARPGGGDDTGPACPRARPMAAVGDRRVAYRSGQPGDLLRAGAAHRLLPVGEGMEPPGADELERAKPGHGSIHQEHLDREIGLHVGLAEEGFGVHVAPVGALRERERLRRSQQGHAADGAERDTNWIV